MESGDWLREELSFKRLWRRLKFARLIFARRLGVGTNKDTLEMQCIRRDEEQIGALL